MKLFARARTRAAKKRGLSRLLRWGWKITLLALIAAGGLAVFLFYAGWAATFEMKKVGEMPERNTVLDVDGKIYSRSSTWPPAARACSGPARDSRSRVRRSFPPFGHRPARRGRRQSGARGCRTARRCTGTADDCQSSPRLRRECGPRGPPAAEPKRAPGDASWRSPAAAGWTAAPATRRGSKAL